MIHQGGGRVGWQREGADYMLMSGTLGHLASAGQPAQPRQRGWVGILGTLELCLASPGQGGTFLESWGAWPVLPSSGQLMFIYPCIKMGEAEQVISKGLSAVKKGISELLNISTSKSAACRLQAADLGVHFDWRVIQARIVASSPVTAWSHYEDWYFNMFHGIKCAHLDDNGYQLMENEISSTSSEP
ncbi:hypothetical protein EDC04DRAFT_2613926 [Pisolithus marmoratus]|nr:hypothetical protein EDC04DRAFT_2613926 [Pisolithus marmoratus]